MSENIQALEFLGYFENNLASKPKFFEILTV
jgi:hypothetical protein